VLAKGDIVRLEDGRTLSCLETVRSLPDKRQVFLGELDGRAVFAKLYLDPKRRQRHWQRELDGIHAFQKRKILTAELLYAGMVGEEKLPVIVLARLHEPVSLKSAWDGSEQAARERLLQHMVELLAAHHKVGLCQTDLHLDNFIISKGLIYSLDGAGVDVTEGELDLKAGLNNLALFSAQLVPKWDLVVPALYELYLEQRRVQHGPGSGYLLQQIKQVREWRWNKFKDKLFRDCTAFRFRKSPEGMEVVSRRYVGPELEHLLDDPDVSFPGVGQALKNGNTSTVWSTLVNGHDMVVKRYNVKGFLHGLKLSLRPSRGKRSWINAHCLQFYGIPTPKPVAFLKRRSRLLFPTVYHITELVKGEKAWHWFRSPAVSNEEKEQMAEKVVLVLQKMQQQWISHGDLKATNILIANGEAMLIDLDAMHKHTNTYRSNYALASDIQRFMKNWEDNDGLYKMFVNALKSHKITLPNQYA